MTHRFFRCISSPARSFSGALALCFLLVLATVGCQCQKSSTESGATATNTTEAAPEDPQATLLKRGKLVYETNCISCHNRDPKQRGGVGPDVWGSSLELLEARVIHGRYPEGYTPKQTSGAMAAMPFLKNDLAALHAHLNRP